MIKQSPLKHLLSGSWNIRTRIIGVFIINKAPADLKSTDFPFTSRQSGRGQDNTQHTHTHTRTHTWNERPTRNWQPKIKLNPKSSRSQASSESVIVIYISHKQEIVCADGESFFRSKINPTRP